MDYQQRIIQAYRNTPWRMQLQIIGLVSASIAFIGLIAGVYLNVSARASTIGREVQGIQATQQVLERDIEDQQTKLANLTSAVTMTERANKKGYKVVSPEQTTYLIVGGYPGKQVAVLAPPASNRPTLGPQLPGDFTISLFEWIRKTVYLISLETGAELEGSRQ
jgi:hypothetical protein